VNLRLRIGFVVLALWLTGIGIAVAESPTQKIEASGTARIHANNVAEAKDAALQSALIEAVERAASDFLTKDQASAAFQGVGALVAANRIASLVQGYRVTAEGRFGDFYRIALQASVLIEPLKAALGESGISTATGPSVLLMIAEKFPGYTKPFFWWGNPSAAGFLCSDSLAAGLKTQGFRILSNQGIADNTTALLGDVAEPEAAKAIQMGTSVGADFVLLGMATLMEGEPQNGVPTVKGLLKLRLLRVKGSEEIGSIVQTALVAQSDTGAAIDEVLRMLGSQISEETSKTLTAAKETLPSKSSLLELTIQGTSKIRFYAQFKQALSAMPGVRKMIVKEMQTDAAIVVVDYQGSAQQLADAMMGHSFNAFSVDIQDVAGGRIRLALTPRS
jgi:hypothetical protein